MVISSSQPQIFTTFLFTTFYKIYSKGENLPQVKFKQRTVESLKINELCSNFDHWATLGKYNLRSQQFTKAIKARLMIAITL